MQSLLKVVQQAIAFEKKKVFLSNKNLNHFPILFHLNKFTIPGADPGFHVRGGGAILET